MILSLWILSETSIILFEVPGIWYSHHHFVVEEDNQIHSCRTYGTPRYFQYMIMYNEHLIGKVDSVFIPYLACFQLCLSLQYLRLLETSLRRALWSLNISKEWGKLLMLFLSLLGQRKGTLLIGQNIARYVFENC